MSYAISSWEISVQDKKAFRGGVLEALIARALHLKIAPNRYELIIRALMPADMGLTKWRTPRQEPGATTLWINMCPAPGTIWGIYKIIQLSMNPKVTTMKFSRAGGNVEVALYQFEQITSLLPLLKKVEEFKTSHALQTIFGQVNNMVMEANLSEPVICQDDDIFQVRVTSPEGNRRGDKLMLGGFVVERIGRTIF